MSTWAGGGITNLLFKLEGPKEEAAILVRIYGEDTDVLIDRERDNALFDELARYTDAAVCVCIYCVLCGCVGAPSAATVSRSGCFVQ